MSNTVDGWCAEEDVFNSPGVIEAFNEAVAEFEAWQLSLSEDEDE